ncbi:MAG: glycoside hydrolase family 88 protein [Acholeplasmataceae bacterium]|nr:glycoside hydrolase family 88 protein [Acholeplasmataceae bacterium]
MNPIIEAYIQRLIDRREDQVLPWNMEAIRHGKALSWNYIDGCMMIALMALWRTRGDRRYLDTVTKHVDRFLDDDGVISGYEIEKFNLDDICESRVLFDLLDATGDKTYQKAIEFTFGHVMRQPRTGEGNFWHKAIYPDQVWLDGLFMAQPFYARYAKHHGREEMFADILNQFRNVRLRMFDEETRLYRHGYDHSKTVFWADPKSGCSKHAWLRAIGWFALSLVETHEAFTGRADAILFQTLLGELIEGMVPYLDAREKMFYQVVDQGHVEGNYLETSGNALMAAAIMKGVRTKMIDASYLTIGEGLFERIIRNQLTHKDGTLNLGGICLVAGLGPKDNPRRDGSVAYYLSEPVVENDAKGVAPFILAYVESIMIQKKEQ